MTDKEIIVKEHSGIERTGEFVSVGIPFAKGELEHPHELSLLDSRGDRQPVQALVLNRWKDGSAKWVLLDFAATVPANGASMYRLVHTGCTLPVFIPSLSIRPGQDEWEVDTGSAVFSIDAREFRPFKSVICRGSQLLSPEKSSCILRLDGDRKLSPRVESITLEMASTVTTILRLEGSFSPENEPELRFCCRLHFFSGSSRTTIEFTLRNGRAAKHPAGLWDLGSEGSLIFRELALNFMFPEGAVRQTSCSPEAGSATHVCGNAWKKLVIYQESSGGENWRSPAHRNSNGEVPFGFRGYRMLMDGKRVGHGRRATPVVWCGTGNTGVGAVLPRFWQQFPTAIEVDRTCLKIAFFPSQFPDLHELQGGEQTTSIVHLDFSVSPQDLAWARSPLVATASPAIYHSSGVIPDLPALAEHGLQTDLVDRYVAGPEIVTGKREHIDEYGWRNFGDLYADHEAVYHCGPEPFISHYNNQYDVCAGMYRKYFMTGNPLWGELAADLARHLMDIDIYHTIQDREEYNGGLFWHTDHYLPAGLASHRSYSREHLKAKNPRFCGGGPGSEHCYTTGLMLHYFMTGNPDYREAVIELAQWNIRLLAGPHPVLAVVRKIGRYLSLVRNTSHASRPAFPRYPLTRGTGNALSACLDAFEVGGGIRFLKHAEELVRGSMHPDDDIDARDLLDAENAWSYTVLLVALVKFLDKKAELEEFDRGYDYARGCLLAYGDWMLRRESPYLDTPEILEYPNETWPAQDLRKSVVLYHAARYSEPEKRHAFLDKARFFFERARKDLDRHATSSFTRPMSLMLQNGWVGNRLEEECSSLIAPAPSPSPHGKPTPNVSIPAVAARIGWEMMRAVRGVSLRREVAWLKARLQN